jgi:hypothetical protein
METDSNMGSVVLEIAVGCKNGYIRAVGHCTEEQIDRCPGNAVRPTEIEESSSLVVIRRKDLQISEVAEAGLDRGEGPFGTNSRENLLADGADETGLSRPY